MQATEGADADGYKSFVVPYGYTGGDNTGKPADICMSGRQYGSMERGTSYRSTTEKGGNGLGNTTKGFQDGGGGHPYRRIGSGGAVAGVLTRGSQDL